MGKKYEDLENEIKEYFYNGVSCSISSKKEHINIILTKIEEFNENEKITEFDKFREEILGIKIDKRKEGVFKIYAAINNIILKKNTNQSNNSHTINYH